jgi:endonuclease YncB( thermonuclease family)
VLRRVSPFWLVVAVLGLAAVAFALDVQRRKAELRQDGPSVETGAIVMLKSVVDGDTVVVRTEAGEDVAVRMVGIKAFDADTGRDAASRIGQEAVAAIERKASQKPIRLELNTPPKDKYGRLLASLGVDEEDLGLGLVREGLVLVYTAYPFPAMGLYLQEQEATKADRRGLWGDASLVRRAELLQREWRMQTP